MGTKTKPDFTTMKNTEFDLVLNLRSYQLELVEDKITIIHEAPDQQHTTVLVMSASEEDRLYNAIAKVRHHLEKIIWKQARRG